MGFVTPRRALGKLAPTRETPAEEVADAIAAIEAYPGVARVDGFQNGWGLYELRWLGISHPGQGRIIATRSWERYCHTVPLAFAANKKTKRKPAAREQSVLLSVKRRRK